MESYLDKFTKYVMNNYDINNNLIMNKYHHSIRVASLMIYLANRLRLSSDDVLLAFIIGLFHDLGRFREVVRSNKFNNMAFDHGAYSNKILFNDGFINQFDIESKDYLVIRKAIYYHNKKDLGNDLNKRELLFSKMIRDVDKLDIVNMRCEGKRLKLNNYPNDRVLNNYFNDESINIKDIHSSNESCVLYLSFIKDLYFDESKIFAINYHYLERLISIIDVNPNLEELLNELKDKIERRGKVYVR